jgi:hypothetical protein
VHRSCCCSKLCSRFRTWATLLRMRMLTWSECLFWQIHASLCYQVMTSIYTWFYNRVMDPITGNFKLPYFMDIPTVFFMSAQQDSDFTKTEFWRQSL